MRKAVALIAAASMALGATAASAYQGAGKAPASSPPGAKTAPPPGGKTSSNQPAAKKPPPPKPCDPGQPKNTNNPGTCGNGPPTTPGSRNNG